LHEARGDNEARATLAAVALHHNGLLVADEIRHLQDQQKY
jgi:hypothetical protein